MMLDPADVMGSLRPRGLCIQHLALCDASAIRIVRELAGTLI